MASARKKKHHISPGCVDIDSPRPKRHLMLPERIDIDEINRMYGAGTSTSIAQNNSYCEKRKSNFKRSIQPEHLDSPTPIRAFTLPLPERIDIEQINRRYGATTSNTKIVRKPKVNRDRDSPTPKQEFMFPLPERIDIDQINRMYGATTSNTNIARKQEVNKDAPPPKQGLLLPEHVDMERINQKYRVCSLYRNVDQNTLHCQKLKSNLGNNLKQNMNILFPKCIDKVNQMCGTTSYNKVVWKSPNNGKKRKLSLYTSRPLVDTRKDDKNVRKELFRNTGSSTRRQTIPRKNLNKKKSILSKKNNSANESIALIDIDIAEQQILNKKTHIRSYSFKAPALPKYNFSSKNETAKVNIKSTSKQAAVQKSSGKKQRRLSSIDNLANDTSSTEEFLELEKQCRSFRKNDLEIEEPPLTDTIKLPVHCNFPSGTKSARHMLTDIREIIEKDRQELELFKKSHQQNIETITNIVAKLEDILKDNYEDDEKENIIPQSSLVSPKVPFSMNKDNLRVATLTKNFSKSVTFDIKSPLEEKMKSALQLYNTVRQDCSILCTPKLKKRDLDTPSSTTKNICKVISRKIQQQCLMLQDTPLQKSKH